MGNEYRAKVFKSGNSVALRLPKALGLTEGMEMVLRAERQGFSVEPLSAGRNTIDLSGIYGSIPGLKLLEEEDRGPDERPLDRQGKLPGRD